ncbi:MAG: hypothetical protein LBN20_03675 [Endomicrobium sp.]|jgi:putative addiction module killer protein|nr:hypothetical protein [Endomicrobium sp.]
MIDVRTTNIFDKWRDKQNKEVRGEITDAIDEVKQGNTSHCKYERGGISEIKIHFGQGIRLYYIKESEILYRLVWGGTDKKRQTADIEKAITIRKFIKGEK